MENKIKELEQKLKAKEQECERLKQILKDKTDKYNKLAVNYDAYVSIANKQLDQLKQNLTEIKEIAEESYRTPLAEKDCIKCDEFLDKILQKISEVLK